MTKPISALWCFVVLILRLSNIQAQNPDGQLLLGESAIVFADVERGRQIVSAEDMFLGKMQMLERQIRLSSPEPVSQQEYVSFLADQVRPWKEDEISRLTRIVKTLGQKMARFNLPFPKRITFVRASAEMESNAPHCRGASVIMPDGFFGEESKMMTILTHELFHVLSSHNPQLRNELYATIGFELGNELELPAQLLVRRLTNPDAPLLEHYLTLQHDNEMISVVPVTLTKTDKYAAGGLFTQLDFKLLLTEKVGDRWQAKLSNGKPQLLSPRSLPEFISKIGRNTPYVIHPEETLADNFWMMVLEKSDVPDPWVIEKMAKILDR